MYVVQGANIRVLNISANPAEGFEKNPFIFVFTLFSV